MPSLTLEVLVILGLIVLNGLFAMSEIAVVSAQKARLRSRAEEGDGQARTALELALHPNRFLSTIQIGITLIGVVAGAYGGANLAAPLAEVLGRSPDLAPYSEEIAYGLVVLAITYLSLIIGELVPKRVALHSPERIASRMARPMHFLSVAAAPAVWFLSQSTDFVLRLLRLREAPEAPVTAEEIRLMLIEGAEAGVIEEEEQEMVERVFRFGDQDVGGVMTPRREIAGLNLEAPPETNRQKLLDLPHARAVAYRGTLDAASGIIHVRPLLARVLAGEPLDLEQAVQPVRFVPEHVSALRMLDHFRRTGEKLALVVDEYGGVAGLVTLDDILEAIVGDIPWVGESLEPDVVQREDGSWLIDGMVTIPEFLDLLDLRALPGTERSDFRTVGGWVTTRLGHIPAAGEHFTWEGYRCEVVDMDGSRVDKLLISPPPASPSPPSDAGAVTAS